MIVSGDSSKFSFLKETTLKKKDIWFKYRSGICADLTSGMNTTGRYTAGATALITNLSLSVCPLYSTGIEACGEAARLMLANGMENHN